MLIQSKIEKFSKLKLIYFNKILNLEIISIDDSQDIIYYPNLIPASLGQIQFRNFLNIVYGFNYNPYCYIQNDKNNFLSTRSIYSWYLFNGCLKLAAFQNGNLIAMRVLTQVLSKKIKNTNIFINPIIKTWLHCVGEKEWHYGILVKIFNRQIEYKFNNHFSNSDILQ